MKNWICLLLALFALVRPASAAGLILVHEEDFWRRPPPRIVPPGPYPPPQRPEPWIPPRPPVWAPLELTSSQVAVRIQDQFATTTVDQEFYNPNARRMEGTFLLPVPKGAHLEKLSMQIDGKTVEAELLTAEKARGIYEDIVRRLQDPALLEYAGSDLFKVRIFPIDPQSRKKIHLSYSQLLKQDSGLVSFLFPLATEKFSAKPPRTVSIKVDLETRQPLKSVYSPSHKVDIARHGSNRATVGYETHDVTPEADFQLLFGQEQDDVGLNLLTYKTPGEDGYFVLLASPGLDTPKTKTIPKDVAFVLDTSGSMAGAKLEQAKKALLFCVENLNTQDRFEILRFATEVEPLFGQLMDVTGERQSKARTFIKDLKPIGGTAIDDALQKALALRPNSQDRPYVIIFLTDGLPTVGTTAEESIVSNVVRSGQGKVRIFCFGIGTDVNTHLLDKVTEETRAFSQYVLPEEDIEVKLSAFFSKIKDPVLANPALAFPEAVRTTRLYPAPLPDLFRGEQLVVVGRYSSSGSGAIRLDGTVAGEKRSRDYEVKFPGESTEQAWIPRLWATRRVGTLLDQIRLHGENSELKEEVVDLARRYGIVTPYTSYLIVEDEGRRGVTQAARTVQSTPVQERELRENYLDLMKSKQGGKALASARSYQSLKAADSPSESIVAGNAEVLRLRQAPMSRAGGANAGSIAAQAESDARQYGQQSRFIGGRTFFQNNHEWVDANLQKAQSNSKLRIQFGSPEFFQLSAAHPETRPWLALGRNVQFVLGQILYEIHE